MQELLEELKGNSIQELSSNHRYIVDYLEARIKTTYLEKEKQQIIDSGNTCALRMRILHDKIERMTTDELLEEANIKTMTFGEEYYNEISEPKQTPQ